MTKIKSHAYSPAATPSANTASWTCELVTYWLARHAAVISARMSSSWSRTSPYLTTCTVNATWAPNRKRQSWSRSSCLRRSTARNILTSEPSSSVKMTRVIFAPSASLLSTRVTTSVTWESHAWYRCFKGELRSWRRRLTQVGRKLASSQKSLPK